MREDKSRLSPIESEKDDILGRDEFVKEVSKSLIHQAGSSKSIVVAICGKWGEGKSSIKNLIKKHCTKEKTKQPIIVEIQPWRLGESDNLNLSFFQELCFQLNESYKEPKLVKKIKSYVGYLKLSENSFNPYNYGLTLSLIIIGIISVLIPLMINFTDSLEEYLAVSFPEYLEFIFLLILILLLIFICSKFFSILNILFKSIAINHSIKNNKYMNEARKDIAEQLRILGELGKAVIVIIDEIDRLRKNQVISLIKILNSNSDFPNLVYLLFFKREAVEDALNTKSNGDGDGHEYIEKMVQVFIDVPNVSKDKIFNLLASEVEKIIEKKPRVGLDKKRFAFMFQSEDTANGHGGDSYFTTLRQVYRFLHSFEFYTNSFFGEGDLLGVNIVDLMGIETIRLFEPAAYHKIKQKKKLLTNSDDLRVISGTLEEYRQTEVGDILNTVSESNKESFKTIITELFPYIHKEIHGNTTAIEKDKYYSDLRICNAVMFSRYFDVDPSSPKHIRLD